MQASLAQAIVGAPCFDNYSLSELLGDASPCPRCGYGHWHILIGLAARDRPALILLCTGSVDVGREGLKLA